MAKKRSILDQMRSNPRDDWQIADIERLAQEVGLRVDAPSRGSHFKVFSPRLHGTLTIPARRPIKPPYIKLLVDLADAHIDAAER